MKTIDLAREPMDILHALELAREGPLVLIGPDGHEYLLTETDNFAREVELLRASPAFQQFLDARMATRHRRPLTHVLREIEAEIAHEQTAGQE